jgi:hypothetical protein
MYLQLMNNLRINFKFYRRNRLLLVVVILMVVVLGLSAIPALFFLTKTKYLVIIKMIFSQFSTFTTIITATLGLLFISHHIGNRTTKMVFTKPCPPEIWLLSGLLSASFVSLILYACIFSICSIFFFVWDVPFQLGIFYITINDFLQAIIILSYITFLTILFHPVIAVLIVLIFQEGTFYYFKLLLMSGIKTAGEGSLSLSLKFAKWIVDTIYMVIPTYEPFSEKMSSVYSSLRISMDDWKYLFLAFAYVVVVSSFLYLLSLYFLKKKRHI